MRSLGLDCLFQIPDPSVENKTDLPDLSHDITDLPVTSNEINDLHVDSNENFTEPNQSQEVSRAGRRLRKPKHLDDYHI